MWSRLSKREDLTRVNIIGKETTISGTIETDGFLRIDGEIYGDILGSNKIFVSETGVLNGNSKADVFILRGKVNGNIHANESFTLKEGGFMDGDILSKSINLEPNSQFYGLCTVDTGDLNSFKAEGNMHSSGFSSNHFSNSSNKNQHNDNATSHHVKASVGENNLLDQTNETNVIGHVLLDKMRNLKSIEAKK